MYVVLRSLFSRSSQLKARRSSSLLTFFGKKGRARNDYDEETAYESYMNPEPGFQSDPGDSTNAD